MGRSSIVVFSIIAFLLAYFVLFTPLKNDNVLTGFAFSSSFPGYAVPLSSISVDINLVFNNASDVVSKSVDVSDDIVYHRAYISLDGQAWVPFNITPSGTGTLSGEWIYGRGISNITFTPSILHLNNTRNFSNNTFIIIYSCSKNITIHNWSCHDGWQIIPFNAKLNTASLIAPTITFVSPTPNSGSTINTSSPEIVASISDDSNVISSWIDFDKSLIGYWSMDSYSSIGIYDNSTYKNFAFFNGGLSMSNIVTGVRGKALSFDGINNYLNMNTQNGLPTGNPYYTIAAWVYSTNCSGSGLASGILKWGIGSNNNANAFVITGNCKLMNYWWNNDVSSTGTVSLNTWSHVAVTYDGSNRTFYINGIMSGSDASSGHNILAGEFKIGSTADDESFKGSLDEVMIFNRALSSSEVKVLYNSKVNKFDASFSNLANGQHSYTLYAVDDAGYFAGSEQRTFNVNAATCTQACSGKQCGSDGCSGTCGTCLSTQTCTSSGQCVNNAVIPNCSDGIQNQGETGIDCGGPCTACSTSYSGTVYYVSNSGLDTNSGTSESTPWQTLTKVNGRTFKPGDAILFKRGDVWYGTLTVTSSGSLTVPITYGAYGTGTNPVITGFTNLTGWTNNGNGVWSKAVSWQSDPNILLFDGVNQPLGRYPHLTSISGWPSSIWTASSATRTTLTSSSIPSPSSINFNTNGAQIVMRSAGATNDRCTITGHSGNTLTFTSTAYDTPPTGAGFFIENHPACLTTLGDWRFENGVIYMYFGSDTPTNHIIKISTLDEIVDLSNSKSYVTLDGLTIEGGNVYNIEIYGGSYITIKNCIVRYGGHNGIQCSSSSHPLIDNNIIDNNNNNGITITSGTYSTVTNNTITNSGKILGMGVFGWTTNVAIAISGSNTLISYNQISNSGYDGINWAGAPSEISYNFINNSCLNAADGAGIYSYRGTGANRVVKYNIVLNSDAQPYGWDYQDWGSGNGIYLDGDGGVSVLNNILAYNEGKGLFINANQATTAQYNTCFSNVIGIEIMSELNTIGIGPPNRDGRARNHIVDHNIFVSQTSAQLCAVFVTLDARSDITLFGTINYNTYARPISNNNYIQSWEYGYNNQRFYDLAGWKASGLGQDANSVVSSASVTDVNNIRFEYNPTTSNKVISLGNNNYVDAKGTSYSGSVTLLPYTAVVLIKT